MAEAPELQGAEVVSLREKVAALEAELGACKSRLEREKKLRLKAQASAAKLRRRIEELCKKNSDSERNEKATSSIEVQTEDAAEWSHGGYYYYNYYSSSDPHDFTRTPVQPSNDNEISSPDCIDQLQPGDHPGVNGAKNDEHGEQDDVLHNVQQSEDPLSAEGTLAESLRAAAEAAVSQTGFIYDESSGLYYDHSTGFYYNSENQLYYDPTTGIYYYCDVESGRYQFHSRVDLQSYGTATAQHSKDRKGKKKRKDAEWPRANEYKVHQLTETMANLKISSSGLATSGEDGDKIWPPCIRVIVVRSPVLQMGSLYIITAVKPATIGREKDMEHTLQIPEVGVSKFHAEVYFDHELQSYVLVDQGSQNGTVVNGNQILQPKTKSEPHVLEHGDEVKIGETVLSFHIHPGSETCDGCEPGQVRAHLRLDKKSESSICPVLTKEEKELVRRKALKQIRVKYGLQNTEYENDKVIKNPNYKDRAGKRRVTVGSEGNFHRDDAPASVHVEISDSNKGHKMLEKMGWKKGEGLGKSGDGMKDPIKLQLRRKHAGLGSNTPVSAEEVQIINTKNKKNWEKARERFAENFQESKTQKNVPKDLTWVRETAE
ncbi:angiogenic factor with G patch and FHA domains 1 isoform X2 [Rhineura floridana]|uniref:angiogenic factor with G patch and FHA domains 1 isoform X2 n=1 Tax=Rhineura floridana TaxID=261503 RepID=UPI002AC7F69D|nr:angiogenic factor with G patch and FHA domains 1 isoform X2 [Rhineura floridana]